MLGYQFEISMIIFPINVYYYRSALGQLVFLLFKPKGLLIFDFKTVRYLT